MINLLLYIVIIAVVVGLAYWIIDAIPVPQPINKFAKILIIVVGVIALIYVLMGIAGNAPSLPR
jgi:hypothetical protein